MKELLSKIDANLAAETTQSFDLVVRYYSELTEMTIVERNSELYSLKSTYSLLQLSATYDIAVKEIFLNLVNAPISDNVGFATYIEEILKTNILNRYMTNIKHNGIKEKFKLTLDEKNPDIQTCANDITSLIKTRNTIAHELNTDVKGHNDVGESLLSVLKYLVWYQNELIEKMHIQKLEA